MNIKDGINSAFQSIFSHKLRSLLTLTGIVIGVLAVVTMFSSVYAIKALIKKNMEGMAENALESAIDAVFNVHCLFHLGFAVGADFNFSFFPAVFFYYVRISTFGTAYRKRLIVSYIFAFRIAIAGIKAASFFGFTGC